MKTGAAVCIGPAPPAEVELDGEPVADDLTFWRDEMRVLTPPAADEEAEPRALVTDPPALEAAPEAVERAPEASDARLLAPEETADPAAPKMVVEPMMEVKTEDPSVMIDWIAEVVRAAEASDATLLAPEAIAPPTGPKMVVEPMIEVMTEDPSVIKDWMAEVVIAAELRAPPADPSPLAVAVAVAVSPPALVESPPAEPGYC